MAHRRTAEVSRVETRVAARPWHLLRPELVCTKTADHGAPVSRTAHYCRRSWAASSVTEAFEDHRHPYAPVGRGPAARSFVKRTFTKCSGQLQSAHGGRRQLVHGGGENAVNCPAMVSSNGLSNVGPPMKLSEM